MILIIDTNSSLGVVLMSQSAVLIVVFSQFIASLSALGMPPFFSLMLEKSFVGSGSGTGGFDFLSAKWAGVLFVIPTFFTAIASPFWGKVADRYGKKKL